MMIPTFSVYENLSSGGIVNVLVQRARVTESTHHHYLYFQNDRGGASHFSGLRNVTVVVGRKDHAENMTKIVQQIRPVAIFLYSHFHLYKTFRSLCGHTFIEFHRSDDASVGAVRKFASKDGVINVPSKWSCDLLKEGAPHLAINVVPNIIDSSVFKPSSEVSSSRSGTPTFMYVGQFGFHKGLTFALQLFGMIRRLQPRAEFELVISQKWTKLELETLLQRAMALDLLNSLRVYSGISQFELARLYRKCAETGGLQVITSQRESFGLCLREGMMCGLPSVAAKVAAIPEMIQHGKNGFLFDYCDLIEASNYVESYMLDHDNAERISRSCRDSVLSERSAESYLEILNVCE